MSIQPLDPRLIHAAATVGHATLSADAIDLIIAKINEIISLGGGGALRTWIYTATGAEPASTFTVTIPSGPLADTNYVAAAAGLALSGGSTTFATKNYTTTTIDIVMGYKPLSGDKIGIIIEELT